MRHPRFLLPLVALAACADPASLAERDLGPTLTVAPAAFESEVRARMDATNVTLAAANAPYRVAMAELITNDGGETAGTTLLQQGVGNKQLSADFVPGDPRRPWSGVATSGDDITYAIDQTPTQRRSLVPPPARRRPRPS